MARPGTGLEHCSALPVTFARQLRHARQATRRRRGSRFIAIARDRRKIIEATAAAAVLSGAPSTAHALLTERSVPAAAAYVREAIRAIGTLVPPWRPGFVRGAIIHVAISSACGELLARTLPERRSAAWGAAAGLAIGIVNMGLIGRLFPAMRALPLIPQLADHVAFGVVFATVVDHRGASHPLG